MYIHVRRNCMTCMHREKIRSYKFTHAILTAKSILEIPSPSAFHMSSIKLFPSDAKKCAQDFQIRSMTNIFRMSVNRCLQLPLYCRATRNGKRIRNWNRNWRIHAAKMSTTQAYVKGYSQKEKDFHKHVL